MAAESRLPDVFGLTALHRAQAAPESPVGSYLALFHAPHQLFCLNPQVPAQREQSREKIR